MKMMTIIAAVFATSVALAATPLEIGKAINLNKKETWSGIVTTENAKEIYDALKATNLWGQAQSVAAIAAFAFENDALYLDYAATVPNTTRINYTNLDNWNGSRIKGNKWQNQRIDPELMIAIGKKFLERGDYENAALALLWYQVENGAWGPILASAELRALILSTYTPEIVSKLRYPRQFSQFLNFAKNVDKLDLSDASEPTLAKYWDAERLKYFVSNSGYLRDFQSQTKTIEWDTIVANNSISVANRLVAAKRIDGRAKDKKASLAIYPFVFENGTFAEKFTLITYLNDADKFLDVFKTVESDATAEQLNKLIEVIVGLDYNYRASEVLDILKNINAKYTLKLYDDRDTWEPVLSKVRALIDVR